MNYNIDCTDCILEKVASVLEEYTDLKGRYTNKINSTAQDKVDIFLEDNFIENLFIMLDRQNLIIRELNQYCRILIEEISYKRLIIENRTNITRQISEKMMNKFLDKMNKQEKLINELKREVEAYRKNEIISMTSPVDKKKIMSESDNSIVKSLTFDGLSVQQSVEATASQQESEGCCGSLINPEGNEILEKIKNKIRNISYDKKIANTVSNNVYVKVKVQKKPNLRKFVTSRNNTNANNNSKQKNISNVSSSMTKFLSSSSDKIEVKRSHDKNKSISSKILSKYYQIIENYNKTAEKVKTRQHGAGSLPPEKRNLRPDMKPKPKSCQYNLDPYRTNTKLLQYINTKYA